MIPTEGLTLHDKDVMWALAAVQGRVEMLADAVHMDDTKLIAELIEQVEYNLVCLKVLCLGGPKEDP